MKTTLEVSDELMRRVKMRVIQRNQRLKDAIAQLLELGMAAERVVRSSGRPPKPLQLKKRGPLTIEDIESAIAAGRD